MEKEHKKKRKEKPYNVQNQQDNQKFKQETNSKIKENSFEPKQTFKISKS